MGVRKEMLIAGRLDGEEDSNQWLSPCGAVAHPTAAAIYSEPTISHGVDAGLESARRRKTFMQLGN